MSTITVYSFEDKDGTESTYMTQDVRKAREYARKYRYKLIANEFEWADSELVEDYTTTGEDEETLQEE